MIAEWMVCPSCLRFRWSPVHGFARLAGWCPGPKGGAW